MAGKEVTQALEVLSFEVDGIDDKHNTKTEKLKSHNRLISDFSVDAWVQKLGL